MSNSRFTHRSFYRPLGLTWGDAWYDNNSTPKLPATRTPCTDPAGRGNPAVHRGNGAAVRRGADDRAPPRAALHLKDRRNGGLGHGTVQGARPALAGGVRRRRSVKQVAS